MIDRLEKFLKDKRVQIAFTAILLLFVLVAGTRHYVRHVKQYANESVKVLQIMCDNMPVEEVKNNQTIEQQLLIDQDFDGFEMRIGGTSADLTGKLYVELYDEKGDKVNAWIGELSNYTCVNFHAFPMPDTVKVENATTYTVKWWISDMNEELYQFYYYRTPLDNYPAGSCYKDGQEQTWDLECNVYQNNTSGKYGFIKVLYWLVALFACMGVVICMLSIEKWNLPTEKLFLITVGSIGILYMFLLPPFSAPDELVHFSTAYGVSNELMGREASDAYGCTYVRAEDANTPYGAIPSMNTYDYTYHNLFQSADNEEVIPYSVQGIVTKNKITHLFSALGITVGRLLHLGAVPTIFLGRIGNFICYLILVYWAIKKMPFGKNVLMMLSLTPMALELITSYSYDTVINGMAFFAVAWILDCIFAKDKVRWKEIGVLVLMALLLGPSKIVYSMIFVLCIFIPREKFDKKIYYWLTGVAVVGAIIGSNVYVNIGSIIAMSGTTATETAEVVVNSATPSYYTLSWCLAHPIDAILIYIRTTITNGPSYVSGMIGRFLGWLEIGLPSYITLAFMLVCGLLIIVRTKDESPEKIKMKHTLTAMFLMIIVYVLVLTSMFFGWTNVGESLIAGVQGRYFIAIVPLIALILTRKKIYLPELVGKYIFAGIYVLHFVTFTQILSVICTR